MRLEYKDGLKIATDMHDYLADLCTQIEIVGSLKRGEATVGDIEILMVLDPKPPRVQFGDRKSYKTRLDQRLATDPEIPYKLQEAIHKANGDKLKRFALTDFSRPADDFCIELYIVKIDTWGIQNVIRTGPKEFSKRYVTNKHAGGLLPNHLNYATGLTKIFDTNKNEFLELLTERAAIGVLSRGWIDPKDRWKLINSDSL